jgi:hypothetical protein
MKVVFVIGRKLNINDTEILTVPEAIPCLINVMSLK